MTASATGFDPPLDAPSPARTVPRLVRPRATLLAALGLGLSAVFVFDGPALGIAFPLFSLLLLGTLLWLGGREGWQRARPNAWLLGPWLFFSTMVFVRASPELTALNVLASGFLLLLLAHFWAAGRVERLGLGAYVSTALGSVGQSLVLAPAIAHAEAERVALRRALPRLLPVARGLLLVLPVLAVFTWLLSSADEVFSGMVAWGLARVGDVFAWSVLERGVLAAVMAFGLLGLLAHALRRRREREAGEGEALPAVSRLGFTESLVLLGAVNVLFLSFVSLQVAFLWGGASLPSGLTYSAYARRGFFELLAVSMLALGLSLALERWTRLRGAGQLNAFRGVCTGMVGLVLILLASAVKRMALYEAAYGYTLLRVYTHVFMLALAGVLLWRGGALWWRPARFAVGAFVGALGCLAALDLLDPEAFIARAHLERALQGLPWDEVYLVESLSEDAVPELARFLDRSPESLAHGAIHRALCRYADSAPGGWPRCHLSRSRAHLAAAALVAPASCVTPP